MSIVKTSGSLVLNEGFSYLCTVNRTAFMIDQPTIDRILDAAQIYDVVSDFVTLRKRGVNYVGLCPFHDDKTPFFLCIPRQRALQVLCLWKRRKCSAFHHGARTDVLS